MLIYAKISRLLLTTISPLLLLATSCRQSAPPERLPSPQPTSSPVQDTVIFNVSASGGGSVTQATPSQLIHTGDTVQWTAVDRGLRFRISFPEGSPCSGGSNHPLPDPSVNGITSCVVGAAKSYRTYISILGTGGPAPASPHFCGGGCSMSVQP